MKKILILLFIVASLCAKAQTIPIWTTVTGIQLANTGQDIQRDGTTGIFRLTTTSATQFSAGDTLYFSTGAATAYNVFGLYKTAGPTAGSTTDFTTNTNVLYAIYTGNTSGTAYMGVTESGTQSLQADPGSNTYIRMIYDPLGFIKYERATSLGGTYSSYKVSSGASGSYSLFGQLAGDVTYSAWRNIYIRKYVSTNSATIKWNKIN